MVNDDERYEMARRLRQAWANFPDANPVRHHLRVLYEIYAAVGLNDDGVDAIDLFDRLADLIEPVERMCLYYDADTNHCGCYDTRLIDRDALLALADEIHGLVENQEIRFFHIVQVHESTLATIEARIREALGVCCED